MTTMMLTSTPPHRLDSRQLLPFVAVALPVGWVLLTIPLFTDLPVEPFVLGTLLFGLVLPALVLTRRDHGTTVRALLRDCVRLPRPWLLVPAVLAIPVLSWAVAGPGGSDASAHNLAATGVTLVSSVLIVNLWEEMAWGGFVQRRATARWGVVGGAAVVTLMFTGIHLPLAFYDVDGAREVLVNVGIMLVAGLGMRLLVAAFDVWGLRSIVLLGVLHASFNATGDPLLHDDQDWVRYAVTLGLGIVAVALPSVRRSTVEDAR